MKGEREKQRHTEKEGGRERERERAKLHVLIVTWREKRERGRASSRVINSVIEVGKYGSREFW